MMSSWALPLRLPRRSFLAFKPGTRPNQVLRACLITVWAVLLVKALIGTVLVAPRFAVDLEIALRGAERWMAGGPPYLASAFGSPPGATQPFLYPPYSLPFIAGLSAIPREIIGPAWVAVMAAAAVFACRRLAIPWVWMPLVLAWPPFAEGIVAANIQVLLFAAFVALFWRSGGRNGRAIARDLSGAAESNVRLGALATAVGAVKVSQPHAWLYLLRSRRRAAIIGAAIATLVVVGTLPLTGVQLWVDWLAQLLRAGDPAWDLGGIAAARFLPPGVGLAIAAATVGALFVIRPWFAGETVGVLAVLGALSLHTFGMLFLLPAMLVIRREIALVAAISITTYSYLGSWAGILTCSIAFAAALSRGSLREPADERA